jgi:Tfp pilus assembly protein PilF
MNISEDLKNRQIIPRWYPFNYAFHLGEIHSVKEPKASIWTPVSYKAKEQEWLSCIELPFAIDFVGTALVSNDYSNAAAIEASTFILTHSDKISNLAKGVAEKFLQLPKTEPSFDLSERKENVNKLASLKKYVRAYPYNAIAWADMAFFYIVLNQNEKADHCISIALNLAPENRFVLRSAARFYLHIENPEKALFYLRKAKITRQDSWLLASEISVSEAFQLKTKNIKVAKEMLLESNIAPKDLSELFGAIGTFEVSNGKNKIAKKLFRNALIDPNENTVAQVEWISRGIGFNFERTQKVEASFEADARRFYRDKEYKEALASSLKWLRYQPFSSQPAQSATYIAGTCLNDFQEVLRIVEEEASSLLDKDFIIKNNYIFSLASLDKVTQAQQQLDSINYGSLEAREQATYHATEGLVRFRQGKIEEGRQLYREAIRRFNILDEKGEALAMLYWIREEKRIMRDVSEMIEKAIRLATKFSLNEVLQQNILH